MCESRVVICNRCRLTPLTSGSGTEGIGEHQLNGVICVKHKGFALSNSVSKAGDSLPATHYPTNNTEGDTMNKQSALERLTALENEAAALRKVIEQPENKGLWKPEISSRYWTVEANGAVDSYVNVNDRRYQAIASRANCFPSRELAEKASPLMARANKVIAAALQVDPDAGTGHEYTVGKKEGSEWQAFRLGYLTRDCRIACVHNIEQAHAMADILNAEGVQ